MLKFSMPCVHALYAPQLTSAIIILYGYLRIITLASILLVSLLHTYDSYVVVDIHTGNDVINWILIHAQDSFHLIL